MRLLRIFGFLPWFMAPIPAVAADHFPVAANSVTLIVKDGKVYASGDARPNRGDNSEVVRNYFQPIAGLKDIVSVDVDCEASDGAVALDKNGDVWMWGRSWCDVVRGKETTDRHIPFKHPSLSGIRSVDLGERHLVALNSDGRVLTIASTYDANELGALGNGNLEAPKPVAPNFGVVEVAGISDAVAIAAGSNASFIVRNDGTVWAMGSRTMLGEPMLALAMYSDPNFEDKLPVPVPQRIKGLKNITAISAGLRFAIALDRKGQVWGWGSNDDGQLGTKITDGDLIAPKKLSGLKDIVSISAGSDFILAADSSGNVFACGGNTYGVLGKDGEGDDGKIQRVPSVAGAKQVVAGYYNAFAVLADGSVMGWGCNDPAVGGFLASSLPTNIPPAVVDVNAKPAPPSKTILAGGVKLNLYFDLSYFRSESVRVEIDGKEVASFTVDADSDRQEAFVEIPAGSHEYQIKGQAITEDGQQHEIVGSGVFLVSQQTMEEKFDSLVAERGVLEGAKQFIKDMDALSDHVSLKPLAFTESKPWSDGQLDAAEKKLGLKLPRGYRKLMKTIGPYQLGHPDSPHPSVSLRPVDAERNLESFVQQILQADPESLPRGPYKEIVELVAYTRGELTSKSILEARKTWDKNLIVGSAGEEMYLLVGENPDGKRETYSVFWTALWGEMETEYGEHVPLDYQWTKYCGDEDEDEAVSGWGGSIYSVLQDHYFSQGVAPLVPDASGQNLYARIQTIDDDNEPKANEKLIYSISSDGW